MSEKICKWISEDLRKPLKDVTRTVALLEDGATIPFISRYRKEATGNMNEVEVLQVNDLWKRFLQLEKRKEIVISSIQEQNQLTDEIEQRIINCRDITELEDIYLPFRPKRITRATKAKKLGLEPLAKKLLNNLNEDPEQLALKFETESLSSEHALQGAKDIIAEWVNESEPCRNIVRSVFRHSALITSKVVKGKEEEANKYQDYFDFSESLHRCPAHRLLAIRRGEQEGFLKVNINPENETDCLERLGSRFLNKKYDAHGTVTDAINDGYKRLLKPSIETEFANLSKEMADKEAIKVFTSNLRQLLLSPPLGSKRVLAIDPGFRTGCKVVCLNEQGELLHNEAIFPHPPQNEKKKAMAKLSQLVATYKIEAIAIGNGTAGRETEQVVKQTHFDRDILLFMVSESGASVYSASAIARAEFPTYDVTVRGAVSIGRRLMDPLAELVKIDPKSIGVGQYQHDVNQTQLQEGLNQTVESCVNSVGVNLNTAGKELLTYVSGLGSVTAENIIQYRNEHGAYKSRKELNKVPGIGPKTFEQCAGFLRIPDAENPLDNSAVHPENYPIITMMAKEVGCDVKELIGNPEKIKQINLNKFTNEDLGLLTLNDIASELEKPGRDPRKPIAMFEFDPNIRTIEDLKEGQTLNGLVTNITNFGVFVDIGIKENGLVHISELTNRFVNDPNEVVTLNQHVRVKILSIDLKRKRIQLSMKEVEQ